MTPQVGRLIWLWCYWIREDWICCYRPVQDCYKISLIFAKSYSLDVASCWNSCPTWELGLQLADLVVPPEELGGQVISGAAAVRCLETHTQSYSTGWYWPFISCIYSRKWLPMIPSANSQCHARRLGWIVLICTRNTTSHTLTSLITHSTKEILENQRFQCLVFICRCKKTVTMNYGDWWENTAYL